MFLRKRYQVVKSGGENKRTCMFEFHVWELSSQPRHRFGDDYIRGIAAGGNTPNPPSLRLWKCPNVEERNHLDQKLWVKLCHKPPIGWWSIASVYSDLGMVKNIAIYPHSWYGEWQTIPIKMVMTGGWLQYDIVLLTLHIFPLTRSKIHVAFLRIHWDGQAVQLRLQSRPPRNMYVFVWNVKYMHIMTDYSKIMCIYIYCTYIYIYICMYIYIYVS